MSETKENKMTQHDKLAQKILARRAKGRNNDKPATETVAEFDGFTKKQMKALLDEFGIEYGKKDTLPMLIALAIENDLTESDADEDED